MFLLAASGCDDDLDQWVEGEDLRKRRKPFFNAGRPRRQSKIEGNDRHFPGAHGLERTRSILGEEDFVILGQRPFHLRPQIFVIINDE